MQKAMRVASSSAFPVSRNDGIDLLRGLSILLVVVHHMGLRVPLKDTWLASFLPRSFLNSLIYNGYEAVFVFFVISGFLITSQLLARHGSLASIELRQFYVRRAARILPCLILLVAVLSALHLTGTEFYTIDTERQSLSRAILAVAGLHLNWYEGQTGYLPGSWDVLWSLSIEEMFYLVFPLMGLTLRSRVVLIALLAALALSLPLTRAAIVGNDIWQEKAYLPGMAAIAAGVLAAFATQHFSMVSRRALRLLTALGTVGISGVLLFGGALWPYLGNGLMLVLTSSVSILLFALHLDAAHVPVSAPRVTSWLRSMGRLSYEIYLSHMFVVFAIVVLARHATLPAYWEFLWYLPAIFGSWLLGMIVARAYSQPCERALRAHWMRFSKGTYAAKDSRPSEQRESSFG
jgi:peptidoglycan/LPS O-acetylase OafA/YrhL